MASPSDAGGAGAPHRKSFGEVLRDRLIERGYTTAIGNPDWSRFAAELDGIKYESLRKALSGERDPSVKIMESCATALEVEPTIFWEYQLAQARDAFDPRKVGADEAFANLQRWLQMR
jgi:transcriptional regulator with XRE-family HTH domain